MSAFGAIENNAEPKLVGNYLATLVNLFFKILPMREKDEPSLLAYEKSLQAELLGCQALMHRVGYDARYLTLLSILQFLIDNPDCPVSEVRREVFKAISICNKLKQTYHDDLAR